jgi:hypothetical protein
MASRPTESPRKTVYDCIMRALVCMEDAAILQLPNGMTMTDVYEDRIDALEEIAGPSRSDVAVKLRAIAVQMRQLADLHEKRYRV